LAARRRNDEVVKALDEQVKGKQSNRAAELVTNAAEKQRLVQAGEEAKENLRAARQRAADKCLALKRGLDVQLVQQRKAIRAGLGMNRLERALNAQVLQKARGP
jgi:small-conductance mechanosensitive channel